jgi:hypothetical protein
VLVRMPASSVSMRPRVCISPDVAPASTPPATAAAVAASGEAPRASSAAESAAPSPNEPSTVRSRVCRTRSAM